jgi:hypothetical protein
MWHADPEKFSQNPPEFNVSLTTMSGEYADKREAKHLARQPPG